MDGSDNNNTLDTKTLGYTHTHPTMKFSSTTLTTLTILLHTPNSTTAFTPWLSKSSSSSSHYPLAAAAADSYCMDPHIHGNDNNPNDNNKGVMIHKDWKPKRGSFAGLRVRRKPGALYSEPVGAVMPDGGMCM